MSLIASILQMTMVESLLATGAVIMNILIIPTLRDTDAAVPRTQSVLSAAAIFIFFVIPYTLMGFFISASVNVLGVVLWSLVGVYRAPTRSNTPPQPAENTSTPTSSTNPQPAD